MSRQDFQPAGQHDEAETPARSITRADSQADALTQLAVELTATGDTVSAGRITAAALARWAMALPLYQRIGPGPMRLAASAAVFRNACRQRHPGQPVAGCLQAPARSSPQ
jgi:hypothetical protein